MYIRDLEVKLQCGDFSFLSLSSSPVLPEVRENNSSYKAAKRYCNICRESQAFPLKSQFPDGFDKISLLS